MFMTKKELKKRYLEQNKIIEYLEKENTSLKKIILGNQIRANKKLINEKLSKVADILFENLYNPVNEAERILKEKKQ